MKKWLALLLTACLTCTLLLTVSAETLDGTLIRSGTADPWILYHDGMYYLTQTGTSRVAVFAAEKLVDFRSTIDDAVVNANIVYNSAEDPTVKELYGADAKLSGTWSPEIHYFSEEEAPGYAGWYMLLALRKKGDDSSQVKMVVLKSTTDSPKGPYGHPTKKDEAGNPIKNYSQPVLDANGVIYAGWGIGQSFLTIREGEYKGIYTTWVTEVDRGTADFYQKIMIAKMENPWTLGSSEPTAIVTPDQTWEQKGSGWSSASQKYLPKVVEGATALYGARGDVYITYSGSGYWSDYGLGQLTWTGGDPLDAKSWVKLPDSTAEDDRLTITNPIFTAKTATDLRGAGHASFLTDASGNGFLCYHAYPYADGEKASSRSSYIEPYYIDYTAWNGTSYGVIRMGLNGNGVAANTASTVTTVASATVTVAAENGITLKMNAENAEGYTIYRSTDGETFELLTTTAATTYVDKATTPDVIYYYRVYPYRGEEIGTVSATVSGKQADDYKLLDVLRLLRHMNGENMPVYSTDDRNNDAKINLADVLSTLQHVLNG
ncbi:MAG: family 43 glycosylhydrolase [Clostridia bacterium]|nr:family 43 glycosylhydrolase [Clostridia bacterium]